MDYVENRFMLVLKDKEWTEEELGMLDPLRIGFCYTNGLAIFVLEGGDIDSSDFYFNIQECDWKDALLNADQVTVEVVLVDQHNDSGNVEKTSGNRVYARRVRRQHQRDAKRV